MNKERFNADSSENVIYDFPDFPIYVRRDPLSKCENYRYEAHFHGDLEFIVALSGEMQFSIDGETVTIPEGAGLFVNAGHIHFGFSETKTECEYLCILVHPSLFCMNPYMERNYVLPLIGDPSLPFALLPPGSQAVQALLQINRFREDNDADYLLKALPGLFTVLQTLCSLQKKNAARPAPKRGFAEMKAMLEFIDRHYAEKLTLEELAAAGHVSKNTCLHVFRQYVGDTPMNYLRSYRLQKSLPLLQSTDKPITEIAYEAGFSGASYFAEAFKAAFGVSPKTYRARGATEPKEETTC